MIGRAPHQNSTVALFKAAREIPLPPAGRPGDGEKERTSSGRPQQDETLSAVSDHREKRRPEWMAASSHCRARLRIEEPGKPGATTASVFIPHPSALIPSSPPLLLPLQILTSWLFGFLAFFFPLDFPPFQSYICIASTTFGRDLCPLLNITCNLNSINLTSWPKLPTAKSARA